MKIRILIAKVFVMACLVAVASTVFTSCGKEKDDNKTENNGNNNNGNNNNNQQHELGPLEQTVWLADTTITTPEIPIIQIPEMSVGFVSTLNFTTDADGFVTLKFDMFESADTMAFTYIFSNNRGIMTAVDNESVSTSFTKKDNMINIHITRDFIDDTSSVLNMVFAYFETQGGLRFNYYKQ